MGATYSAEDIARYTVNKCIKEKQPISNLQLQKILYFMQVNHYQQTGMFLFDDDFEAWRYGPVVKDVYRLFSIWGGRKISRAVLSGTDIDPETTELIDKIIEDYRVKSPWALVEEAHAKDKPWYQVFYLGEGNKAVIKKSLLCQ